MARIAGSVQLEIDELKAKLSAAVREKESIDSQEQMDYDVETFGDLRDQTLSKRLFNEIHINKNLSDRVHAEVKHFIFQYFEISNKKRVRPILLNYNNPATKTIL